MDFPEKYTDDLIDEYLMDQLGVDEKQSLELDMHNNSALYRYVTTRKEILFGVIAYNDHKLIENIKNVEKSLDEENFFITDFDIDNYLMGISDLSENRKIELHCARDKSFSTHIEQQRILISGIKNKAALDLKENIEMVEKELETEGLFSLSSQHKINPKPNKQNRLRIFRWTAFAASILLLALATRFWVSSPIKNQPIFQSYFVVLEDKLSPKIEAELSETGFGGSPSNSLKTLQKGMEYYQNKRYLESTLILKDYIKQNPMAHNIDEVQLYTAIAYMSLDKPKEALPFLLSLSASQPQGEIASDLQWYLALCYLQNIQEVEGKTILEALHSNNKYRKKAVDLLQKLN